MGNIVRTQQQFTKINTDNDIINQENIKKSQFIDDMIEIIKSNKSIDFKPLVSKDKYYLIVSELNNQNVDLNEYKIDTFIHLNKLNTRTIINMSEEKIINHLDMYYKFYGRHDTHFISQLYLNNIELKEDVKHRYQLINLLFSKNINKKFKGVYEAFATAFATDPEYVYNFFIKNKITEINFNVEKLVNYMANKNICIDELVKVYTYFDYSYFNDEKLIMSNENRTMIITKLLKQDILFIKIYTKDVDYNFILNFAVENKLIKEFGNSLEYYMKSYDFIKEYIIKILIIDKKYYLPCNIDYKGDIYLELAYYVMMNNANKVQELFTADIDVNKHIVNCESLMTLAKRGNCFNIIDNIFKHDIKI